MQLLHVFAVILVAASASAQDIPEYPTLSDGYSELQSFPDMEETYRVMESLFGDGPLRRPRFRRQVTMDPKTGDVTYNHRTNNGRAFGTLGQNDNGLFGRAGYEHNVFNDNRGRLDAQAHGTRTLGPYGATSGLGGALNWRGDHASASLEANKQIHGGTSWTAAGGGRWPVGRNGQVGVEGTYSQAHGMRDYGGRGFFKYNF